MYLINLIKTKHYRFESTMRFQQLQIYILQLNFWGKKMYGVVTLAAKELYVKIRGIGRVVLSKL